MNITRRYLNVVLVLCILWLAYLFISLPHLIWHPSFLLSWFMSKGLIIHKDVMHVHFSMATFFSYPFLKFTNWNNEVEPLLSFVIAVLTVFILWKFSKTFLSNKAISLALFFFSLLFYYFTTGVQYTMEAICGLFTITSFFVFFKIYRSKSISKLHQLTLGILVSLSLLFDQIAILVLGILIIADVFWVINRKQRKLLSLIMFFLGLLIPSFLFVMYFVINKAFSDFFYQTVTYYFLYAKLANEGGNLKFLPWKDILFFYSPLMFVPFFITKKNIELMLLSLASLVSVPTIIFSVYHPHHYLYVLPLLALLIGFTFDSIAKSKTIAVKSLTIFVSIFLFSHSIFTIFPWYIHKIQTNNKNGVINLIDSNDEASLVVLWIKNNTNENSKILVAGDSVVYFASNRLPSSKYFTVLPWLYKPIDKTYEEMKDFLPDYWIVSSSYLRRLSSRDGWDSPEVSKYITDLLEEKYVQEIAFDDWGIWKRSTSF